MVGCAVDNGLFSRQIATNDDECIDCKEGDIYGNGAGREVARQDKFDHLPVCSIEVRRFLISWPVL
jgi:hypothetical protein